MRGDINATELFEKENEEMRTRLGYGILDVEFGSTGGVGFEDVRRFSHIDNEEEDIKVFRRRIFNLIGRYYTNELARALWYKFLDHKWVLSEQAGFEIGLEEAAHDWLKKYSHDFFKEWALKQSEVPFRLRYRNEPRRGWFGLATGQMTPQWRELLEVGFSLPAIALASLIEMRHGQQYHYLRLVGRLSGHRIKDAAEATRRQAEIKQLEQYLSQHTNTMYGTRPATIEYYRRLNLVAEIEGKALPGSLVLV